MILIKEENITKANFISSIIVVSLLSIAFITTFTFFTYRYLNKELTESEKKFVSLQKERIKAAVDNTISRFEMAISFAENREGSMLQEREIQKNIISILDRSAQNNIETEYVFILKLHDINGGNEFGTMLLNPNLPELVGRKIPDSYKGEHGKEFVKEVLPKLKADGDAFVHYWFKKPGSKKPTPKITYWKLFPKWQWIVGKGIYLDDLDDILAQKKEAASVELKRSLFQIVGICLCFMVGAIFLAYLFYRSINTMFAEYKIKYMKQQRELQRFDLILNQAHDGIAITDLSGKYIYVNKSMAGMHGYESSEITGRHMSFLHTKEQMSKEVMPITKKVLDKGFARGEVSCIHRDGSIFPTTTSATLLFNENREPDGVLGIVIDISDIVRAKQKAEIANVAKSTFLANMSHEIRTPMNGIIGMTRLALETSLNREQEKLLKGVQISANGLLKLLNDILDFSKIEAGQLVIEKRDFSLPAMLDNIISMLTFDAEKKGLALNLTTSMDGLPAFVRGDEFRLRQILVNLIGNGIKFTQKGSVTIEVSFEGRHENSLELCFTVFDTGIGISVDRQEDIFSHFSQADTSTARKFGGSGLGLAITKQLVEMMDGSIWVESTEGQGTAFHFTTIVEYGDKKSLLGNSIKIKYGLKDLNILLVEDNEINRDLAQIVLAKGECHVIPAKDGREALTILSEREIDIVLMDIQMPVMDGFTATKIIRGFETGRVEQEELPADLADDLSSRLEGCHLPIVAMTANAMSGDKEKCLEAGMDDYLTKPFVPEDIFSVISRYRLKPGVDNG